MELKYHVYILHCDDNTYYTGYSAAITKRLEAHRKGEVSYTKSRLPVKLIHLSSFLNKKKACDFERYLKSEFGAAFRNKRLL